MTKRVATYAFVVLTILGSITQAQTAQLKGCRLTLRPPLTLGQSSKPIRLSGAFLKEGKNEYRIKVSSDLKLDVQLKTDSQLRLDIYSLKPPKKLATRTDHWSETLSKDDEYSLVVSNCYGTMNGAYKIEIKVVR